MHYVQIHELISYPASNLNRDDLNRPKTVKIGDGTRLRISSQSLKRAWRTSDVMNEAFPEIGIRTNKLSEAIETALVNGFTLKDTMMECGKAVRNPVDKKKAKAVSLEIDEAIRTAKGDSKKKSEKSDDDKESKDNKQKKKQLFHYSPAEIDAVEEIMEAISNGENPEIGGIIRDFDFPADIAMFGRMVANDKNYSCEAAVQVAHAYTVHKTVVEDDFFTAVDDLNEDDDSGAGHLGELGFGAGLFYIYICVDFDLLVKNIGSEEKAMSALRALIRASSTVTPTGKQASFASRAYASYVLVEKGDAQPRSLSAAFLNPIRGDDLLGKSIEEIRKTEKNLDSAFGMCYDSKYEIDVQGGHGSMDELMKFLEE